MVWDLDNITPGTRAVVRLFLERTDGISLPPSLAEPILADVCFIQHTWGELVAEVTGQTPFVYRGPRLYGRFDVRIESLEGEFLWRIEGVLPRSNTFQYQVLDDGDQVLIQP